MPAIHLLPREVSELIAAGEVIERPASIVKELIENAIDAGSTAISVEIQAGGIRYIRVTDNGCGIFPADAPKAFLRHATSKVKEAEDLDRIGTLGFRGEALASIAAVAHVEMMTRPADEELGTLVKVSGSGEAEVSECGCPAGTTMIIRDIFYNVPARLKFLKKDVTEGNAVASIVDKIALSHPEISFRFIRDGKPQYNTPGDGELMSAVYTVLGRDFAKSLIPVEYELGSVKVTGLTCRPMGSRPKRNMQHFFINGRYTQSRTCTAALERGYDGAMMVGKFPACVLMLEMPCEEVDVNVHPAKIEVRFVNEKAVFDAVYFAVKSAVAASEAIGKPAFEGRPASAVNILSQFGTEKITLPEKPADEEKTPAIPAPAAEEELPLPEAPPAPEEKPEPEELPLPEDAKPADVSAPGARYQVKEEWLPPKRPAVRLDVEPDPRDFEEIPAADSVRSTGKARRPSDILSASPLSGMLSADTAYHVSAPGEPFRTKPEEPETAEEQPVSVLTPEPRQQIEVFGEIFSTYILARIDSELVIIDKHAAHERILYNQFREQHEKLDRQMLLISAQVSLTRQEHQTVLENLDLFADLGFEAEDFGGSSVLVRSVPAIVSDCAPEVLFTEAVAALTDSGKKTVSAVEEILHRMACRAAVKGGDRNRPEELETLVRRIASDEKVRYCPHGRPVMIRYTKKELEKLFGRIQ
ncbi:MAG: DNA mismatch repair endonuclease MutL [Oscillospiraceae bacterium]|nr:DNA mismatch repair endonuclease MutL [Oscillospiraceae bacterium]